MAGFLTTHVLDTSRGSPGAGIAVTLYRIEGASRQEMAQAVTNADGRTDAPILPQARFQTGRYELVFAAGEYLRQAGHPLSDPVFLDEIPIRFGMAEAAHYHVPLLLSPYGYSTYRGS
ncbi:MAG: hydroxyisourate hydrolase [Pseudomonadota bacterium]